MGQMPPWMSPSPVGGYGTPKFNPPPSERPPGFLKTSSPSTKAAGGVKDASEKPRLPVKSLRNDSDDVSTRQLSEDGATLPTKAKSMPNIGEEDDSPLEEGDGRADSCRLDCRYCHLCPEGELKKR